MVRWVWILCLLVGCGDDSTVDDAGAADTAADTPRVDAEEDAGEDAGDEDAAEDTGVDDASADAPPGDSSVPGDRIVVHPDNPAWLAYASGDPFFLCGPGDPEDFLYRGTRNADGTRDGDQSALIAKLAPTGANGIYFQAIRSHGGDGEADHNPFVDSDPTMGLDEDILDQWEGWFDEMEAAGIVIYFFFYDDSARIWNTGDDVGTEEEAFVTAIVDRFEHHGRLIWVIAEEYQERFSAARVSNIAANIRAADDGDHVIGVHKLGGLEFDEFADDPNIDQFAIQYNVSTPVQVHDGMVSAFGDALGRYNLNMSEIADHGVGANARSMSWAAAMGGAYVMVLGQDIAGTDAADLEDCGRMVQFMESTDFASMEPHDELASGSTDYVLASPGDAYILYATEASDGDLGVQGLDLGSYSLTWFAPDDGTTSMETIDVTETDASFSPPRGGEMALYLVRL